MKPQIFLKPDQLDGFFVGLIHGNHNKDAPSKVHATFSLHF